MKEKIKEFYLETSERTAKYSQLVAITESGKEFIIGGDYCGGIPVSSWHEILPTPPLTE